MRYLFINSVAGFGSTGRIAAEQCRALMAEGHECVLAYGRDKANCDDISTHCIGSSLDYKIHGVLTRVFDAHGFASQGPTRKFLAWATEYDPEVLWLHNIHGYYLNIALLFAWIKSRPQMKVKWTLHDCWTFTGHCAYFDYAGCDRWMTGCHHCPQKKTYPASMLCENSKHNFTKKKALFTGVKDMTLITPSQWMADLVKQSFLNAYPVQVVYNTINTDIFKPTESDFRKKHGLEDKKIILGVANIWEKRKGLQDLLALAGMVDESWHIVLVGTIPEEQKTEFPANVLWISRTESPQELAEIYTAADVFVNPTYEDNYPTVNLESLACGTPVITYRTGGSPESLDETCGAVVDRNPQALLYALLHMEFTTEACLQRSRVINSLSKNDLT